MVSFIEEWEKVIIAHKISRSQIPQELEDHLAGVYSAINAEELDLAVVKSRLERLFIFLTSEKGRNDINCRLTDLLFCVAEGCNGTGCQESYQEVTSDIGFGLHDTITSPEVARNFYAFPEQILDRILRL